MQVVQANRRSSSVSLTPLIDVVFILLLFFMLATTFGHGSVITMGAGAKNGAASESREAVLLRLKGHALDFNGSAIRLEELPERLDPFLQRNPEQRVLVQTDHQVSIQQLVHVLDLLAASGATNLELIE